MVEREENSGTLGTIAQCNLNTWQDVISGGTLLWTLIDKNNKVQRLYVGVSRNDVTYGICYGDGVDIRYYALLCCMNTYNLRLSGIDQNDSPGYNSGIVTINSDAYGVGGGSNTSRIQLTAPSRMHSLSQAPYETMDELINALREALGIGGSITYRLTNCTAPQAPASAITGSTVIVELEFPNGFAVINPGTDVIVRNNGIVINSNYTAGQSNTGSVSFIMP